MSKVTIREVAKKAKVSVASVSYVLNGIEKVSSKTKLRILKAMEELEFSPDINARNLAKRERTIVGIILPANESYKKTILTDNPFYQEILNGIEYSARKNNLSTMILGINEKTKDFRNLDINNMLGLIIIGAIEAKLCEIIGNMNISVILIDQKEEKYNFTSIRSDDYSGAYLAVDYLIKNGHHKIALVNGAVQDSDVHKNRYNGYIKALEDNNIKCNTDLIFTTSLDYDGGVKIAEKLFYKKEELTAVFCISDIVAIGIIKGLLKKGVKIPEDISIVGYDDIKESRYFNPEITTIRQDIFCKGEKAVYILVEANKGKKIKKEYILPIELVERDSVRKLI